MQQDVETLQKLSQDNKIIPVVVLLDWKKAIPLAKTLIKAQITIIEITLRTDQALEAIAALSGEVENIKIGAGTVLTTKDFEKAKKAGADFIVSPGLTKDLAQIAHDTKTALLPGAITPTEIMQAIQFGYHYLKFFPALQSGGLPYIKALSSPFSKIKFCPTGGIKHQTAKDWLNLSNVFCLGGSWITPKPFIDEGNFEEIYLRAKKAKALIQTL